MKTDKHLLGGSTGFGLLVLIMTLMTGNANAAQESAGASLIALTVVNSYQEPVSGAEIEVRDEQGNALFMGEADDFGSLLLQPEVDLASVSQQEYVLVKATDPLNNQVSGSYRVAVDGGSATLILGDSLARLPQPLKQLLNQDDGPGFVSAVRNQLAVPEWLVFPAK